MDLQPKNEIADCFTQGGLLIVLFSAALVAMPLTSAHSSGIPASKGSQYVMTLLGHNPVFQEKSLPKITIVYPQGKSEQFLKQADQYSALFSQKGYLTSVTSAGNLTGKIQQSDLLLLLSSEVDPSRYVSAAQQHSVMTIAMGTKQVLRNKVAVSIDRTKQDEMQLHVNWKKLKNSKHSLSYKLLNLAKVHR
jgi:hypothetical protein